MMDQKLITPSILNVDKDERVETILKLIKLGIKWFHYDVMDNKFVSNKAIDVEEIINFYNQLPKHLCDVHLMVENPFEYAKKLSPFVTCLTAHYESFKNEDEIMEFINEFANTNWIGLSIKPNTKIEEIIQIVHYFDIILIMSVEPGFGGQKFIEESFDKIKKLKKYIDENKIPTIIQVDGGINDTNSKKIFNSGSTYNVVGSYLINNISKETLKKLK